MKAERIRQAGFFAALLLVLCIIDARFERGVLPHAVATHLHSLSVQVSGKTTSTSKTTWTSELLLQSPGKAGRSLFHPAGTLSAVLGTSMQTQLPQGKYWLITRAPGFARDARRIDLDQQRKIEIKLGLARTLEVRDMVEKGDELVPLAGATVLTGNRGELSEGSATKDDGRVRFDDLPEGPVRVRIFAPGYESYEAETEGDLLVKLRPTSTLRVSVFDDGQPVHDAEVIVAGVSLWPTRTVMTGLTGRVDISGLKPGHYSMMARKGDRVSPVNSTVEVLGEQGHSEITLTLEAGHHALLQVIDNEKQTPVPDARVTWNSAGLGQFAHHELTDERGKARIGPLPELGGTLTVRARGFVSAIVPVETPGDGADEGQIIRLVRAASITGRVVDLAGFPVRGATVEALGTASDGMPISVSYQSEAIPDAHFDWASDFHHDPSNVLVPIGELGVMLGPVPPIPLGEVRERVGNLLTTDKKGRFIIEGVPPGEVVVLARHPAHMDGKSKVLLLSPGSEAEVEIVLGEGRPLRGRVLDHRGFPIARARIQIIGRGFEQRVTAETDGTFDVGAAPEKVSLRVSLPENPFRFVFSKEVEPKERDKEVKVELPEPRDDAVFLIVDANHDPIELAQLTLVSVTRDVPFKQTRFSQAEGRVLMEESEGLTVRMSIQAPGYVPVRKKLKVKKENLVELVPAVRASGRVLGVRGRLGADGAEVVFESGTTVKRTTANVLGEYRLTGLPPGSGVLRATHPDYGKGSLAVQVESQRLNREAPLPDLQLRPTIEISGEVKDTSGRALSGVVLSTERLSPFLTASGLAQALGRTDERGRFTVSVQHEREIYLYGASPGRAFGWSDAINVGDRERIEDVVVLLDHPDAAVVNQRGTLLFGMEERDGELVVFAVAPGSQAALSGVRPEDVIQEIDGEVPRDEKDARDLISGLPGTDVRLVLLRGRDSLELLVARELFAR